MRFSALLLASMSTVVLAEEPTCSVSLIEAGDQKINVIKVIREYTPLGLREAKDLIDAPKPKLIREGLPCADANAFQAALVAKGAKAEVHQKGAHGPAHPVKAEAPAAATWDVKLESWGTSKILVIKIVRDRTGLGLADTKKLVESAPAVVVKGLNRAQADAMLTELTAAGAKASLIPTR